MRALFQIVSSAGSERGAFRSEQWIAHPSFNGLRDLANEDLLMREGSVR